MTAEAPIACDFPACAVHHICTKPCERNKGKEDPCIHHWKVTHQGVLWADVRCDKCGARERKSWD